MFERWLFLHDGRRYGPMPMAGVMRQAAAGKLLPNEPLWPEDFDSEMAFPASATIDFAALAKLPSTVPTPRPAAAPIPDWLSDVQENEALNRRASTPAPSAAPDWLNDVQQVEQLIRRVKPPPVAQLVPVALLVSPIPTTPPRSAPPATLPLAQPVPVAPPLGQPGRVAPPVSPVPAVPPRSAPPAAPPRVTPALAPVVPIPARVTPPAPVPPQSAPVPGPSVPAAARISPPIPAPPPALPSPQETGYDPATGQILDAAKFKKWQREQQQLQQQAAAAESGETIYETFRRARNILSAWADLDEKRDLLTRGNMNEVRQDPEIVRIMQSYQGYGHELVRKLWDNLEFLVENRRKFYVSRA